jgi:hypothetical protein
VSDLSRQNSAVHGGSITPEQKKRRFRELAKQERIRTGRQLAEELAQPFLPLMDVKAGRELASGRGRK